MNDSIEYKCPCCGGTVLFDSALQKMKCPYCETVFEMETFSPKDEGMDQTPENSSDWEIPAGNSWQEGEQEGMFVYVCNSCGGEIVGDASMAATSCPYCDNPVVIKAQFSGDLRPDLVIPFQLDKKAAMEKFHHHLSGKTLLPKVFKKENHIDEIKGIYVPFWLFDCKAHGNIKYKCERIRRFSDHRYNYVETSHFSVYREGEMDFRYIPVDGSTKIADDLMESLEPYDFSKGVDFKTAYLSGYLADRYNVSSSESIGRANQRIQTSVQEEIRSSVQGYHSVLTEKSNISTSEGIVHYALLPVWLLNTTWKGNRYVFAMNGQTGKFVGNLPCDKGAYWRWFFSIFAGIGALATIIGMFFF